ncbi:MAG: PH domain-containing protein [Candidatus Hydrogenedentes bacterium]|nr:PH domain-containing protein [Candidatus Hydrogenedentota bacterium]
MSDAGPVVYPSKRDIGIAAIVWAAATMILLAAGSLWAAPVSLAFRLGMSALSAVSTALLLWVLYGTRYTLTDQAIVIRAGPFRWTVPQESITEIYPTHNPLSSPACSLDRLYIRYRKSRFGVMVSPKDKAAFLADVVARSPGLKLEGQRVVREQ